MTDIKQAIELIRTKRSEALLYEDRMLTGKVKFDLTSLELRENEIATYCGIIFDLMRVEQSQKEATP